MATIYTTDWDTTVRCLKKDGGPTISYNEGKQTIPQQANCIKMPGITEGPMGRPIDANLAVSLISNFYKEAANAYGPETIDGLEKDELKELYKNAREFLNKLVHLNYGMTMDKNFALKLLSQPKCEGIRSYLCYKESQDPPISTVSVGVDADGFDLNYNKPDTVTFGKGVTGAVLHAANGGAKSIDDVNMESLNGEYVNPPYDLQLMDLKMYDQQTDDGTEFQKRFVLLNIATGQTDLLEFNEPAS